MAVFMSILLVGALWYIAGVGDFIVYRERMQEAADSVAFSAAIIQARGMNIIVLINLLMAAILAIRVAINMLKLLCTVLGALFSALGLIPFLEWMEPIGDALDEFAVLLTEVDAETTPFIDDALTGLHDAWTAVKDATPALAEAAGLEMEEKYAPLVDMGASVPGVSKSLPPESEVLPVQDGSLDKLCREAGDAVGGFFGLILGGNTVVSNALAGPLGALAGGDPSYFCQLPGLTGESPDVSSSTCNDAKGKVSNDKDASAKANAACDNAAGATSVGTPLTGAPSEYAPAEIRQEPTQWRNGINEAQIAAMLTVSSKGKSFVDHDPKLVKIASVGKVNMPEPSLASGQTAAWAQAEFFYDWPGAWADMKDDAMWNFYWRARFRLTKPSALPTVAGDAD